MEAGVPEVPEVPKVSGFQLRPYQLQSVDDLQAEFAYGKSAVLLVAPTGSGKTAVGCHFVKQAVGGDENAFGSPTGPNCSGRPRSDLHKTTEFATA